ILFICLLGSAPMSAAVSSSTIQPAAQQESPPNPSDSSAPRTVKTSGPQGQNSSSPKPAAATPPSPSGQNQPAATKRRWRHRKKKKAGSPDCNSSAPATNSAATDT